MPSGLSSSLFGNQSMRKETVLQIFGVTRESNNNVFLKSYINNQVHLCHENAFYFKNNFGLQDLNIHPFLICMLTPMFFCSENS